MVLPLILLLPLLGSIVPLCCRDRGRGFCALMTAICPAIALVLLLLLGIETFHQQIPRVSVDWFPALGLSLALRLDGLSLLFALLILGIGLLVILYARYYLSSQDSPQRFYCSLMLFMASMLGVVMADNLLLLWCFWEMTSIASFLLIGFWTHEPLARKGARMALTVTGAGGLCLLACVLLIKRVVGSFDLSVVLHCGDALRESSLYPVILTLLLLAAFTKSAQFPFQFWLPHAMAAPTPVSAYLHSATMVKAGIFLMIRMFPVMGETPMWSYVITIVGLVTMFYGAYLAMVQYDLKALLAYSTISHLGLITFLIGIDTKLAMLAAVFHVINHAIFKAALFMAVGIVDHECGTRDTRKLRGLFRFMPYTAVLATVAAASMAGVPLFNGFLSKEMFLTESLQIHSFGALSWMIPALATFGSALSVAYSLRLVLDVFYRGYPRWLPKKPHEAPRFMRLPLEVMTVLCLGVGIMPATLVGPLLDKAMMVVAPDVLKGQDLSPWHGFSFPLLMSMGAIVLGALIYTIRSSISSFRRDFLISNANIVFDSAVKVTIMSCGKLQEAISNNSLQRYMFLMLMMVLAFASTGLLRMSSLLGGLPLTPISPLIAAGALVMAGGVIATVYFQRRRLIALICLSVVELTIILTFICFSAADLALTQLVVSVASIILMMLALFFLPQRTPKTSSGPRLLRDAVLSGLLGVVIASLCLAVLTEPYETIAHFYNNNSVPLGGGHNVVNVLLVDFRAFDTMGEITVLGITSLGVFKLLNRLKLFIPSTSAENRPWSPEYYPTILGAASQMLLPLALLMSLYMLLRGHQMPGGGFIAGLIASAALILLYMARGVEWTTRRLRIDYQHVIATGILISLGTGVGSMLLGYPFLTSTYGHWTLPILGDVELASAMLFDLGVFFTVIGATMMILTLLGKVATPHSPSHMTRRLRRARRYKEGR